MDDKAEDFFDNILYRELKSQLCYLGLYPYQENQTRYVRQTIVLVSIISLVIPQIRSLTTMIRIQDMDKVVTCLSPLIVNTVCIVKIVNVVIHMEEFRKIFSRIKDAWVELSDEDEIGIMTEYTEKGRMYGNVYRNLLLTILVLFTLMPLTPPIMDLVLPLNESRQRSLLFDVDYGVDPNDYFYIVSVHMTWSSLCSLAVVFTVDSMYMIIVYHLSGLCALCSFRIKNLTVNAGTEYYENSMRGRRLLNQHFRERVLTHKEFLEFSEFLESSGRFSYLVQVGLNMIIISFTGIQIVIKLDKFDELTKFVVYLIGQNFHLFYNSLISQALIDCSTKFLSDIYCTEWYNMTVELQTMFTVIQMRAARPCKLTAGGLFDINLESFALVLKTSMSYFMMFMQVREASLGIDD